MAASTWSRCRFIYNDIQTIVGYYQSAAFLRLFRKDVQAQHSGQARDNAQKGEMWRHDLHIVLKMTGTMTSTRSNGAEATLAGGASKNAGYTAVVYVHGIGEQQRYAPLSQFLHYQDRFIAQYGPAPQYDFCFEQSRVELGDGSIIYQETTWPAGSTGARRRVRFYEAYWAHHAVDGTNALSVLRWVVQQADKPKAVRRAPWSALPNLRLGTLISMYEALYPRPILRRRAGHNDGAPPTSLPDDRTSRAYAQVVNAYEAFRQTRPLVTPQPKPWLQFWPLCCLWSWKATRFRRHDRQSWLPFIIQGLRCAPRDHSFYAFYQFLKGQLTGLNASGADDPTREEILGLARRWWITHGLEQLRYQFVITMLWLTLGLIFALMATTAVSLPLSLAVLVNAIYQAQGPFSLPWTNDFYLLVSALSAVVFLVLFMRLRAPLRTYLGDVQQYVTYQETDTKYRRRQAIRQEVVQLLRHVMCDPACERIVVVAHSLGSVIAYDAIVELQRSLRTKLPSPETREMEKNLLKIDSFVTMGSPIDKIAYFFTAIQSKYPNYVNLVRWLRGGMHEPPFLDAQGQPHLSWVNYWDKGDPISGPIDNVVGPVFLRQRVENIQVTSYRLPIPDRNHGGYFEHTRVLRDIFMIINPSARIVERRRAGTADQQTPHAPGRAVSSTFRRIGLFLKTFAVALLPVMLAVALGWMLYQFWMVVTHTRIVSRFMGNFFLWNHDTPGLMAAFWFLVSVVILGIVVVWIWKTASHTMSIDHRQAQRFATIHFVNEPDRPARPSRMEMHLSDRQEHATIPDQE